MFSTVLAYKRSNTTVLGDAYTLELYSGATLDKSEAAATSTAVPVYTYHVLVHKLLKRLYGA